MMRAVLFAYMYVHVPKATNFSGQIFAGFVAINFKFCVSLVI